MRSESFVSVKVSYGSTWLEERSDESSRLSIRSYPVRNGRTAWTGRSFTVVLNDSKTGFPSQAVFRNNFMWILHEG